MRFPVHKIVYPKDLQGQINGRIDRALLRKVQPSGLLHHQAARAWRELCEAARKDSIHLTHTGAYRIYLSQYRLFRTRYSKKPTGRIPQVTRIWNGTTWYLRKRAAPSATPGKSKHGWGLSCDVALNINGKTVPISANPPGRYSSGIEWLLEHAVNFGWCWEIANPTDPNFEVWHLVYFAGDKTPTPFAQTPETPTSTEGPSS